MGVEHGVEDALDEGDLVGGVDRRKLGQRVAGRVDEGVDALRDGVRRVGVDGRLAAGASDFEVEGRDGGVGGGDVGGQVVFCDVFWGDRFSFYEVLAGRSKLGDMVIRPWTEKMAARTGRASSKVMEERAMKAWRKARLESL